VSSFLNIRVADIQTIYKTWSERGAHFLTPPTDRGQETRCCDAVFERHHADARLLVFNAPAFRALLPRAPRVRRKVVSRAALRLASSS
jgi:hypothetical protein